MSINLLSIASQQTITNDELVHIPPGYQYLVSGNFDLNPEHPPLVKMWASLPMLLIKPAPGLNEGVDREWGPRTLNHSLNFWRSNRLQYKAISFWARVPIVAITIALGALIFMYGRQLFGARAAVFAVILFTLEPTMLGHGWVVHTDMAGALGYLLFFLTLHQFCRAPTISRGIGLGLATGFALLTKFSLVITVPVLILGLAYVLWRSYRPGSSRIQVAASCGLVILIVVLAINAGYLFQHPELAPADAAWLDGAMPDVSQHVRPAIRTLSTVLPTYYLFGIYTVVVHNQFGHSAAVLGNYGNSGWWYYFPVAFAFKTTVPFLLLSICSLAWAFWRLIVKGEKKFLLLLVPMGLYLAVSMSSSINIGIRHIAPVFPFLFLLGGVGLDRFLRTRRPKLAQVLVALLLGWMVFTAVRAYPDYLSFMNELTLGRPGWQLLSDSNVEWGQDVGALAQYLKAHGETTVTGALSGGWATLELYDIHMVGFAPADIRAARTRYVAIGGSFLNGSTVPGDLRDTNGQVISEEQRRNYFAAYRWATPEAVFGNSIYLYRADVTQTVSLR